MKTFILIFRELKIPRDGYTYTSARYDVETRLDAHLLESRKPLYSIGDKVRIINYGHLIWENRNAEDPKLSFTDVVWRDMSPDLVGQEGIVEKVNVTQGIPSYSINGIKGKSSWYNEGQMQMVFKNPNNE